MNDVKVCGEKGLVTYCVRCQDWEPFVTELGGPATCLACGQRLPKVEKYANPEPEGEPPKSCEDCDGSGIFDTADPGCPPPEGRRFVERCDACQIYAGDVEAALQVDPRAERHDCECGTWHATVPQEH